MRLMRREDLISEIKIAALDKKEVSEVAKNMLGGVPPLDLAEKLIEESQGNPLFVVESLRMLSERGGLVRDGDQWRLSVGELGIPPKIKDIILQRLGLLLRSQRKMLDAASVVGERFNVDILASVLGSNRLETIETLDAIEKNTSLVSYEGELYRFDHARSRESIYEEISSPLKKAYHAKVAETLETINVDGKLPSSDLAYHFAKAGNKEKAVKFALVAGQDALARWSNTEAIRNFTYVVEATLEDRQRTGERESALEGLGDAFYASSLYKEAARMFVQLADGTRNGVISLRALRKAIDSAFHLGETSYLVELVKKAELYPAPDRLENARILMCKARALTSQNMFGRASEYSEATLHVFEEEYSLWDVAQCLTNGLPLAAMGRQIEGLTEILRCIALFEELGDISHQMAARFLAGATFRSCALWNEALDMFARVVQIDEKTKLGNYPQLVHAYAFSSEIFEYTGDFENALSHILKALEISCKTDSLAVQGVVFAHLAIQYVQCGDMTHAEYYFEKLMKLPQEILLHRFVPTELAKAVIFAGKQQWKESNEHFTKILERFNAYSKGKASPTPSWLFHHAWALKMQGKVEKAEAELKEIEKIRQEADERFEHANLQAHIMARSQAVVGQEFEIRVDLINVGRKPAELVKIEGFALSEFNIVGLPSYCSQQNGSILTKDKVVDSFKVETIKLKLKATKAGSYDIISEATYLDDLGRTRTFKLNTITIIARLAQPTYETLPERIGTGLTELDSLLLGGVPEGYAVALAASSGDERQLLIRRFLEAGIETGQTTFYVTVEAETAKTLAEKNQSNLYLFLCNPRADAMIQNLPNIFKLKGLESLTEIDIALTKAFRTLGSSPAGPRRACIGIVSDVLLQHHALITRKWLSALLSDLKSKGFTIIAVIDPSMHPSEEFQAVLSLFDGEIRISERENTLGVEKVLKILRLYNRRYSEREMVLTKEKIFESS